jgi:teichuronic acid biosynthesis glycosyltransferase TuaG
MALGAIVPMSMTSFLSTKQDGHHRRTTFPAGFENDLQAITISYDKDLRMIKTTVSAIIPCFNSEHTIERAIDSILNSKTIPNEILIYDDFSSDRTVDRITKISKNKPYIKLYCGNENKGAGYARSYLLQRSTCDFFAFLDSDDVWYPDKLSMQIELMLSQNADICACGCDIFDKDGNNVGQRIPPPKITFWNMHLADWIPTSTAMVRSGLIGAKEMSTIRHRQDYAYWLNILKENKDVKCISIRKPLGGHYRHDDSLSSQKMKNLKYNYHMFHNVMGYSHATSSLCVAANVITRMFRV